MGKPEARLGLRFRLAFPVNSRFGGEDGGDPLEFYRGIAAAGGEIAEH